MQHLFDIAADLDTPVSAFLKLQPFKPRFLLESVEDGTQLGRYSFIGFGDGLEVRLSAEDGLIVNGVVRERPKDKQALLNALRELQQQAPILGADAEIPFRGGLVGVMGYDIVRYFEKLPLSTEKKTNLPEAAFFAPSSMLVFDHLTRRAALLHAGSDVSHAALRNNVIAALRGPVPLSTDKQFADYGAPTASMGQEEFEQRVRWAQEQIAAGEVFQLVLSVCFSGKCSIDPFIAYRALRLLNPSPYMYFFDIGDAQVVGSSPEALVRLQEGVASLRPIAGTRPRGDSTKEDVAHEQSLLDDPKENAEHVMLVDLARNDLGRVAVPGSINVKPYRVIERYSHVMHLVSGVQGEVEPGFDAFDLFAAAFPAGTLVGAPKVRAMELIEEAEPVRRDFYAGTVGYFDHDGNLDQAIAIRTMIFHQGEYRYQAGAGVVADSVPRLEYEEVLHKSNILRQALAEAKTMSREGL